MRRNGISSLQDIAEEYPDMKELWDDYYDDDSAKVLYDLDDFWNICDKAEATRSVSGKDYQYISKE